MTSERAKQIIENYENKFGKISHDFFIIANRIDGVYTYKQLLSIIEKEEVLQEVRKKKD